MEETHDAARVHPTVGLLVIALIAGGATYAACRLWRSHIENAIFTGTFPSYPWPTQHAVWSAVIVFGAILIGGRVWLFMRRLESA